MSDSKLDKLAEVEGKTVDDLLQDAVIREDCKGICMNEGCDYTTEVEPDQQAGYCEVCGTKTVKSACVLAGIM